MLGPHKSVRALSVTVPVRKYLDVSKSYGVSDLRMDTRDVKC